MEPDKDEIITALEHRISELETSECEHRVLNAMLRAALEAIAATAEYHEHPSIIIARQALTPDLTAAAEVGEQDREQRIKNEVALVERAIAHTIERCAQVAENYGTRARDVAEGIAAAIRALAK